MNTIEKKAIFREVKQVLKPLFHNSITPKEILQESFKIYSAGWDHTGTRINTGLSFEEEAFFLPMIINHQPNDPQFRQKVTEWYATLSEQVYYDGLELDASYEELDGKIIPKNIKHYLLSRMLQADSTVKSNLRTEHDYDEYACKFELLDKSKQKEVENEKFAVDAAAMIEYVKLINSESSLETIKEILIIHYKSLDVNVIDIAKYDSLEAKQELKKILEKEPEKFTKTAKDPQVKLRALIVEAIALDVISIIGDSYYFGEEKVGGKLKEVATYIQSNQDLKIKMQEIVISRRKEYSK